MSGNTPNQSGVGVQPARPARPGSSRPRRGVDQGPVRIEVRGREAVVAPAPLDFLASQLTTRHRDYRPGGPRGLEPVEVAEEHFRFEPPDRLWIAAGLVPRVADLLQGDGHRVEVVDMTPRRPRLQLDLARLGAGAPEAAALARAIATRRWGLIAAPHASRTALIAAAMTFFPEASVTAVTATRSEANKLGEQLGPLVGEPVAVFTGAFFLSYQRLRVCTPGSLDEREADILLFAEADQSFQHRFDDVFERLVNQHVYAFTATTPGRGQRSPLTVERRLGPVIFEVPAAAPRAGVVVLVADTPWAPAPGPADGLERKRRAIWHADRRNDAVAAVALALARDDRAALWEHGLLLDAGDDPLGGPDRPPRVAVLTESPEHARELARRLPDWPVRDRGTGRPAGCGPGPWPSIVTLVHARRRKRLDLDVLVRADGGAGALDLPGFPPRLRDAEGGQVVLVDFHDDFDHEASKATRGRLRAYEGRRWSVAASARRGGRR